MFFHFSLSCRNSGFWTKRKHHFWWYYGIYKLQMEKFFRLWLLQDDKFVKTTPSTVFEQSIWNFALLLQKYWKCSPGFFLKKINILTKLQFLKLRNFHNMAYTGWQLRIIYFFHSVSAINLKLCTITCCRYIQVVHLRLWKRKHHFWQITAFSNIESFQVKTNTGCSSWGVGDRKH